MSTAQPREDVRARDEVRIVRRWARFQAGVAGGMIVVLALPMVAISRAFLPPLAIAVALFAIPLGLMTVRPRASAIAVGVLSAVWLLLQLANLPRVAPDLMRPEATLNFLVTLGMVVLPLAGVAGLVGTVRRS